MKKKIILSLATLVAVIAGITGMAAFEAHVINVTAKIENALSVDTTPIDFGTVFPQEPLDKYIDIALSASFIGEDRVDDVEYIIRQKPKCWSETDQAYGKVTEDGQGNYICIQSDTASDYAMLPMLCPFLSKHEVTDEAVENDSAGINAFHGPISGWDIDDTIATQVAGRLAKSESDFLDTWKIDLRVPCFESHCAQDWDQFVYDNNPTADPNAYKLPDDLEHAIFGCDLWIEVTEVSESNGCIPVPEVCDDGIDNDCDGAVDCDDSDCDNDPACQNVVINEVAWMGMPVCQSTKEWIELRNMTDNPIDLSGWTLISATDGSPAITLTGVIPANGPNGYYLLERTAGSVPNADQVYSGALVDTGEKLELKNASAILIDSVDGETSGWPAGNSSPKDTMERCETGATWRDSLNPGGTPKAFNTSCN